MKTLALNQPAPLNSSKPAPEKAKSGIQMYLDTLCYQTRERLELINISKDLNALIHKNGMKAGLILVQSLHTTTAVFINEFQQALMDDIKTFLERLVGRMDYWRHNDPKLSECSRQNADAHLRAMVLGHTISVPVRNGEMALGGWQSILLAELDGPRERSIHVQLIGTAE
jgi:secondary thiamine-phosphate synthase enzyme